MELLGALGLLIAAETTYLTYASLGNRKPKGATGSIVLDTSALIDGRILAIARSGFISARLIVPKSVVRELQYMADKADHDKRERARYGLDMIRSLQTLDGITVEVLDDGETHADGVDEQLITIAKKLGAQLCTTDYNLNKVARVESIGVVNVNELAHALRPMHLPGERLPITIVQSGQGNDQGVGYLDDGTMVVVDRAKRMIGETVEVEAVRVLQTEAGRMLFARRINNESQTAKNVTPRAEETEQPRSVPSEPKARMPRRQKPRPPKNKWRPQTPEDALIQLANSDERNNKQ